MRLTTLLFMIAVIPSGALAQQGFTCSYGDRGACLGYGDTVCSSRGRCVSDDAVCFDSNQCNYEGFTCKSNLTECADEYDGLQTRFNTLVNEYNELLEDSREMRTAFQSALEDLEKTQDALISTRSELFVAREELEEAQGELMKIQSCMLALGRLDEPSICVP
tara:strand:+ start:115 stop:603 length:489 start_codon:yes stop_codon:yes gene_type:complete